MERALSCKSSQASSSHTSRATPHRTTWRTAVQLHTSRHGMARHRTHSGMCTVACARTQHTCHPAGWVC